MLTQGVVRKWVASKKKGKVIFTSSMGGLFTPANTGYNETMADNSFRWLDESKHFTKRADLRTGFDDFFAPREGKMDPKEMLDRMIEIVPADHGLFRNVVPKIIEDMLEEASTGRVEQRNLAVVG